MYIRLYFPICIHLSILPLLPIYFHPQHPNPCLVQKIFFPSFNQSSSFHIDPPCTQLFLPYPYPGPSESYSTWGGPLLSSPVLSLRSTPYVLRFIGRHGQSWVKKSKERITSINGRRNKSASDPGPIGKPYPSFVASPRSLDLKDNAN